MESICSTQENTNKMTLKYLNIFLILLFGACSDLRNEESFCYFLQNIYLQKCDNNPFSGILIFRGLDNNVSEVVKIERGLVKNIVTYGYSGEIISQYSYFIDNNKIGLSNLVKNIQIANELDTEGSIIASEVEVIINQDSITKLNESQIIKIYKDVTVNSISVISKPNPKIRFTTGAVDGWLYLVWIDSNDSLKIHKY
jgi:hypothetical protein